MGWGAGVFIFSYYLFFKCLLSLVWCQNELESEKTRKPIPVGPISIEKTQESAALAKSECFSKL